MLKFTILLALDALFGVATAGVLLAVMLPVLIGRHVIAPGDLAGAVLVAVVLVVAVAGMVLRPGSALNRCRRQKE